MSQVKDCNITFHSLGETDRSAMPLGNGECAASVWTEQNGDICLYINRTDALTELDRTVKVGMVRLSITPSPLGTKAFAQTLDIEHGVIRITDGGSCLTVCIPPEEHTVYITGELAAPADITARHICWRTGAILPHGQLADVTESADIVESAGDTVRFYHQNGKPVIEETAQLQSMGDYIDTLPDFLTGRIFGGQMGFAEEGAAAQDGAVVLRGAAHFTLKIATESLQGSREDFFAALDRRFTAAPDAQTAIARAAAYWTKYWADSYLRVTGDEPGERVMLDEVKAYIQEPTEYTCDCPSAITRAYTLTRYMFACCNRGAFPVLYTGMLFNLMPGAGEHLSFWTFARGYTSQPGEPTLELNPDERSWCTEHLWQNLRHPFHSLLLRGETEAMQVLFRYMRRFWDLNRARAKVFYHAEGQHNTEMTMSFGLQSKDIYGVDRRDLAIGYSQNRSGGAVDISPGLELIMLMLDYVDYMKDNAFLLDEAVPYTLDLLRYIATRFPNRRDGKMVIGPLQSIETYFNTINPLPVVAGMHAVIGRLLRYTLPEDVRSALTGYRDMLPEIKLEQHGGTTVIAPAEAYDGERHNVEPPAFYAIFPFKLYSFHQPEYPLAVDTFNTAMRENDLFQPFALGKNPGAPSYSGWQYSGTTAALLGLTDTAAEILRNNCALNNPGNRFPAMWGPIYDAVPDTDHGANILTQLQYMVMQVDGETIYLLPAFPKTWDVEFKLHADKDTVVEAVYRGGKLERCTVTPPERAKDVVVVPAK